MLKFFTIILFVSCLSVLTLGGCPTVNKSKRAFEPDESKKPVAVKGDFGAEVSETIASGRNLDLSDHLPQVKRTMMQDDRGNEGKIANVKRRLAVSEADSAKKMQMIDDVLK